MKKIAIKTFGCKINQYESNCILNDFIKHKFSKAYFREKADVYVINSCTVTNRTDYKSRNAIRKALKRKSEDPNITVIVTGCYSQRNFEKIKELGDVDFVVDNNSKSNIFDIYRKSKNDFKDILSLDSFDEITTDSLYNSTRAFIKVQDGCDFYCSYCAIPYARGHSRSRDKDLVLDQIKTLADNGYGEFVLGGINLGLYGRDKKDNYFLPELISDIAKIEKVNIIRLSSIEPQLFDEKLIKVLKDCGKISEHFHIPLQSGSDEILKSMNRHYTTGEFYRIINRIKTAFPDSAIGIDIISGFPGESVENFEESADFLDSLNIEYIHGFSYSKRDGTVAGEMKKHVQGDIIKERNKRLIEISDRKTEKYKDYLIEKNIVLHGVIEKLKNNYWTALSDHFIRVYCKSSFNLLGETLKFIPIRKFRDGIEVKIID